MICLFKNSQSTRRHQKNLKKKESDKPTYFYNDHVVEYVNCQLHHSHQRNVN